MTPSGLLAEINGAVLTPVARRVLGRDDASLIDWRVETISYPNVAPSSLGLYRVSGTADVSGVATPWSVILKALRDSVHSPAYPYLVAALREGEVAPLLQEFLWNREVWAYRSGLLDRLPDGLAAPRWYGIEEHPGDVVWLWLEDLTDRHGGCWPLARFGLAARHLGRWSGRYLAGEPLPELAWLGRDFLPRWIDVVVPRVLRLCETPVLHDPATWEHPVLRRAFPVPVAGRLQRLWAERHAFLDVLASLPRALRHGDAFRPNLFARLRADGVDETVVIDWAMLGVGAIGEEIGQLVGASLLWFEAEAEDAEALGETVFEGYLAGLREAGWHGDSSDARLGFAASAALRWALPAPGLSFVLDDARRAERAKVWGRSEDAMVAQHARTTRYLLRLADEARRLAERRRASTEQVTWARR